MNIFSAILIIFGLCLFEAISSVDNAIINAEVLSGMSKRARFWFLSWGIFFAVFVVRGLLPWVIIWATAPQLGFWGAFTAMFSGNSHAVTAIEESSPILLIGGGVFLVLLFFSWFFCEKKNCAFSYETTVMQKRPWFYLTTGAVLALALWLAWQKSFLMVVSIVVGVVVFLVTHAFKMSAERKEKELLGSRASDLSKIFYLEILDTTFSIDGVLGAFAFTLSVPLILAGNGLGAIVVRQMTVGNIERVKKYLYLKNGAMYSVLFLGLFMVVRSFGLKVPEWVTPIVTFTIIGFFFMKSKKLLRSCTASI